MVRTLTVYEFLFGVEALAPEAIKSAVMIEIDIPGFVNLREDFLYIADVILIGRANKMVV